MAIAIREERPSDIPAIRDVNQRAFAQEQEANLVDALRSNHARRRHVVTRAMRTSLGALLLLAAASVDGGAATHLQVGGGPAAAGPTPKERCRFEGFDTKFALVVTARATDGYVLCPPGGGCRPSPLKADEPIVVYYAERGWTCAGLPGGPGWVRSSDTQPIAGDPRPPFDAWVGTWENSTGRMTIRRSTTAGALAVDGSARWEGGNGVVHTGEFSSEATPNGDRLHIDDGTCVVDLALHGAFILAQDNGMGMCGGMNVRFWGIWRRNPARR
jgi:hypothetical protein